MFQKIEWKAGARRVQSRHLGVAVDETAPRHDGGQEGRPVDGLRRLPRKSAADLQHGVPLPRADLLGHDRPVPERPVEGRIGKGGGVHEDLLHAGHLRSLLHRRSRCDQHLLSLRLRRRRGRGGSHRIAVGIRRKSGPAVRTPAIGRACSMRGSTAVHLVRGGGWQVVRS